MPGLVIVSHSAALSSVPWPILISPPVKGVGGEFGQVEDSGKEAK